MLVAIDPGENIGVAFRFDTGTWGTLTINKSDGSSDERMYALMHRIMDRVHGTKLDAVVIESFLGIQYRGSHGIETLELIGAVRGICVIGNIPCIKQTPAMRKGGEPAAKQMLEIRKAELRLKFTNHEVSALAHLLTYERRNGKGASGTESASGLVRASSIPVQA